MSTFVFEPESLSPYYRVRLGKDFNGTYFIEVYSVDRLRRVAELERLHAEHATDPDSHVADILAFAIDEDSGLRMSAQGGEEHILKIARSYCILNETIIDVLRAS